MSARKGGKMNTVTYSTALVIAIVCIVIGFVTGGFIGYTNKDRRKKKADDAPSSNPAVPAAPPTVDSAKFTELLRLWREKEGSGLFVETSGHLLSSSEPLNDRQKKRFIDLIKELAVWLNIPPATISERLIEPRPAEIENNAIPVAALQAAHTVETESQPAAPTRNASQPVKTVPIPPLQPVSAVEEIPVQIQTPPQIPVYNPPPKPAPKPVVESAKKGNGSMVEQIDDVLQEVIEKSNKPDMKIRLVEEPKEGVIVWVGHEHFIGIDAVPDPIVKDLIRAAVKEWDRRTESRP
jgi:hypothetical protein